MWDRNIAGDKPQPLPAIRLETDPRGSAVKSDRLEFRQERKNRGGVLVGRPQHVRSGADDRTDIRYSTLEHLLASAHESSLTAARRAFAANLARAAEIRAVGLETPADWLDDVSGLG